MKKLLYHNNEEENDLKHKWKKETEEKQAEEMFFEKFLIKLYRFNMSSID